MELIEIDHSKCKKDNICVDECPFSLILPATADSFPVARKAAPRVCIDCGHCLAVCPHQALTFRGQDAASCLPLKPELEMDQAAAAQFLKSRRSIRSYKKKRVPREQIEALIDICRWAPSTKNQQPVKWIVIDSPEELNRLILLTLEWLKETRTFPGIVNTWEQEGRDMVLRGAPHLLIAYASDKIEKPEIDCVIATSYLELAAHSLGLGTCWAGIFLGAAFRHPPLLKALAIPEGNTVEGALMLGYPKYRYRRIPQRNPAEITWR